MAVEADRRVLDESAFRRMIAIERKRSERSRKPLLLMLLEIGGSASSKSGRLLAKIAKLLSLSTRETDITGWYKKDAVLGVMFIDLVADDKSAIPSMLARVSGTLRDNLTFEQFSRVTLSLHAYPEGWEHELSHRPSNPTLYPDIAIRDQSRRLTQIVKRAMDIAGGSVALIIAAPLFLVIAIAIKLTSRGPVFFRQQRSGQHGKPFIFLKFRSMHVDNDAGVHKQWFSKFVSGQAERHPTNGNGNGSFKMTHDPRVTRVGRFLRRTSLDELPQFVNVLKGEMSLVGPRPPIPYEVDSYQAWHRGRVLQAKPGITGLWQVSGRSRVTFDEMVRLDLKYARNWSLWLDIKILFKTPLAVIKGEGAY